MSRVGGRLPKEADSVKRMKMRTSGDDRARGQLILQEAQQYYSAMEKFRRDRDRAKRYTYGNQWSDLVTVDGVTMTEEEYIRRQGNIPLQTNLIRRLVRSVIGVYRGQSTEPVCFARDEDEQRYVETISTLLQYNFQLNQMTEMSAREMENYLVSGLAVLKMEHDWDQNKMDCWIKPTPLDAFFVDNNMRDYRGWDCRMIGEIHDLAMGELLAKFAKDPQSYNRLVEIYKNAQDMMANSTSWDEFGTGRNKKYHDFLFPKDSSICRVIEVWRKEQKPRWLCHDWATGDMFKCDEKDKADMVDAENARRIEQGKAVGVPVEDIALIEVVRFLVDDCWYYYYLSPFGDILDEGETPYEHGSHPYAFKGYPFIDGEIHSFVSDVIDIQRSTNRTRMLHDMIVRSSAKGVLLVPKDALGGASEQAFADAWAKPNGVVVYTPSKTGNKPEQVSANATNIGIADILAADMKFFEDISGVNGALQGKPGYSGISAALYSQQQQNATTSLLDILDSYSELIRMVAYKTVKNIQQFYDDKDIVRIAGESGVKVDSPSRVRDVEADISIVQSQATPVSRAINNDFLMELFREKAINIKQLLENGNFPFKDKLLQSIETQQEQIANGETPQGIPPEVMQQVNAGANPAAVQQLRQNGMA